MDQLELWGQIGATLYLTPEEADAFHALDNTTEPHFANLIRERRYTINDQFYAPDFDESDPNSVHLDRDIFINLNEAGRKDNAFSEATADAHLKLWCRMGIVLFIDSRQLEILKSQRHLAANLVYDLVSANRHEVQGSCSFEAGIERDGYICPTADFHIDYFSHQGFSGNEQDPAISL